VHIWKVRLDGPALADSEASVLSSDETARANRFHFEKDRVRFIRCRSALRRLLGEYLAIPAAEIHFKYLTNGKPQVNAEQNPRSLQFNVSHSADLALIAVGVIGAIGNEKQLGVDIEKIRGDVDTNLLSERFFSSLEREGLRWLPEHLRVPGFFACWTRKEALLKATGDGLSVPLADFSVSTHPDHDPEVAEIRGDPEAGKRWFLVDLNVEGDYRAVLAVECPHVWLETYAFKRA
jgi:4'-phosphopantetheinyl transferase